MLLTLVYLLLMAYGGLSLNLFLITSTFVLDALTLVIVAGIISGDFENTDSDLLDEP